MARVYRPRGEVRSISRHGELRAASTEGIYRISDDVELVEPGCGEAVDVLDEPAYAISGIVRYRGHNIEFGSRVLDLAISPSGHLAIAGKSREARLRIDGEIRSLEADNRVTGIDRLDDERVVYVTRSGQAIVATIEGELLDRISVNRPFTSVLAYNGRIFVGVSDGGIYEFSVGGEIRYAGEHVRRVFGLDYDRFLRSVGEDRYLKARLDGSLVRSRKLHFDTRDVAAYSGSVAVAGPRYIRIAEAEEV